MSPLRICLAGLAFFWSSVALADLPKPATLSQTLDWMLERALPSHPDAYIDRAARNIRLDAAGEMVINPDNIHAVLRNIEDGAERKAELDRFMATILASVTESPFDAPLPLDRVFPVVRHASFAENDGAEALYWEPFMGDMVKVYALDYPDRVAYVTRDAMADADMSAPELDVIAAGNMRGKGMQAQFETNDLFYFILLDGFYESSFILDGALWSDVSQQLGDDLVMAVPARDILVFAEAQNATGRAALEDIKRQVLATGSHPLSDLTYIWRNGALEVLE